MGSGGDSAVLQEQDFLHFREVIEPMGNEQDNFIFGVCLQVRKDRILRGPVQSREGVIQNQHRTGMSQGPGQSQTLGLTAG